MNKSINEIISSIHETVDFIVLSGFSCEDKKAHSILDARSAAFFAYSYSKSKQVRVALVVEECYLSNIYTAMTESWFQNVPLIVIAVNSSGYDGIQYLERCVSKIAFESSIPDVKKLIDGYNGDKPILIKIATSIPTEVEYNVSSLIEAIRLKYNNRIEVFNPMGNCEGELIFPISAEHKYGIISKYIGRLTVFSESLLIIPEHLLELDSNVFNIRNLPKGFKVIIIEESGNYAEKMSNWLVANGISQFDNLDDFLDSKNASIYLTNI